jgi:hypothetical protein
MELTITYLTMIALRLLLNTLSLVEAAGQGGVVLNSSNLPDFDFFTLGIGLAGISFGLCAVMIIGAPLFGPEGEKALRTWLPNILRGIVLLGVSGFIIGLLGG